MSLEKLLSKKLNSLVLDRKLSLIKDALQNLLCESTALMNTKLRDDTLQLVDSLIEADPDLFLDKTYLLRLSRMPISSMSRADALETIFSILKSNVVLKKANLDLEIDALKQSNDFGKWTPNLERIISNVKKSDTDFDSKYLVLLCSPTWREELGFGAKLLGQPFQLREAQTTKKEYSSIKKTGNLESATTLYLQLEDSSIVTLNKKLKLKSVPNLLVSIRIPSHPLLLELKNDHIVVWSWAESSKGKYQQQTLQHSLVNPTFIDAVVCPSGIILIQVGIRNEITGGLTDFESISVRFDTKTNLLHPDDLQDEDMERQDALDKKRLEGLDIDFRDHTSLLSVSVNTNGSSTVYFQSNILLQSDDVIVGALGCPQEFFCVYANGLVQLMHNMKMVEEYDIGAGIEACLI
jgi:hypothetical protein